MILSPYSLDLSIKDKIETIAKEIYGADNVTYDTAATTAIRRIEELGYGNLPVCMAKNQYSLSDDPTKLGRPGDLMFILEKYMYQQVQAL